MLAQTKVKVQCKDSILGQSWNDNSFIVHPNNPSKDENLDKWVLNMNMFNFYSSHWASSLHPLCIFDTYFYLIASKVRTIKRLSNDLSSNCFLAELHIFPCVTISYPKRTSFLADRAEIQLNLKWESDEFGTLATIIFMPHNYEWYHFTHNEKK